MKIIFVGKFCILREYFFCAEGVESVERETKRKTSDMWKSDLTIATIIRTRERSCD